MTPLRPWLATLGIVTGSTTVSRAEAPSASTIDLGLGKGLTVANENERQTLQVRARVQLQAFVAGDEADDPAETQALVRRLRLLFQGNAWGKKLTYTIQLGLANRDTEPDLRLPIRDAYITWTLHRDFGLRFGQMKVPFGRQRVNSSSAMELVDRSIVVGEFNLDRDVGVYAFSRDLFGWRDTLSYSAGVFAGDGRNRTSEVPGVLVVGQIQTTPFGAFDTLSEGDLDRLPNPRLALSVSAAKNQNTVRAQSTFGSVYELDSFSYAHAALAGLFKWRGFSIKAEALVRKADENRHIGIPKDETASITEYSRSGRGAFLQAGQMLSENIQMVARYGDMAPSQGTDPKFQRRQELGGGLNYYFAKHNLKLQTDYFYLFGPAGNVHQLRWQFQLYL